MIQTKITKDIYHGDGTTRRFEVTFDYNTKNNIKQIDLYTCTYTTEEGVTKYNNDVTKITSNYDFEVVNDVTYAVYPSDAAVSDGATPMAAGTAIIIMRDTPQEQLSTGQYNSAKVEQQLDNVVMMVQEQQEQLDRSYKAPEYAEDVDEADFVTVAQSIDNINDIAENLTDIDTVKNNLTDITTVATNISDVNTVGQNISDINNVATNITDVSTVSSNISSVTDVADNISAIVYAGENIADISAVADNLTDISTVADNATDVTTVASISTAVSKVADNESNINMVSDNMANVNTIASNMNSVLTVSGDISNVNTVAGNTTNINTVAGISSNVTTVAGIASDVTDVKNNATNINTVATNISNVNTAATNISNINTAASNIAAIIAAPTAAQNAATSATNAQKWAEGTDTDVTPLGGTHSSKGWANRAQEIAESLGAIYKPAGSIAFASLPALSADVLGNVYNITDSFTTTADFVEGAGDNYPAGTNVAIVDVGTGGSHSYKYDVLSGVVDLSAYRTAAQQDVIDSGKQATLVSGTNIKTINNNSILGSGNLALESLPSQTGNSGKFLTTDGTDASWSDKPLVNTATQSNSLAIGGSIGTNTGQTVVVGQNAQARYGSFCTAVGASATASIVGGSNGLAVGYNASVTKSYATQLGNGTNSDANTFKVGNANGNYELMSADGTIPVARLNTMTGADGTNAGAQGAVPAPAATDNTKFLKGDGTWANPTATASWGNITGTLSDQTDLQNELNSKAPAVLLSHFWSDHIINEISYLRGDTFSWQSGDVYTAAYNHLTNDLYKDFLFDFRNDSDYYIYGSPTIQDGIVSGIKDKQNTVGTASAISLTDNDSLEIKLKLLNTGNSACGLFDTITSIDSKCTLGASSGISWKANYAESTSTTVNMPLSTFDWRNRDVLYIKLNCSHKDSNNNTTYSISVSTDDILWITVSSVANYRIQNLALRFGSSGNDLSYGTTVNYSIDLNESYVKKNTAQTETIGNYTITYYLADDGHKIVLADQEQNVLDIYNATGVARYFILDTTNTRFKLPRWKHNKYQATAPVIGNGMTLGITNGSNDYATNAGNSGNVAFYTGNLNQAVGTNSSGTILSYNSYTGIGITTDPTKSGIEATLEEDDMYLYFYVGNFTQSATEQTAGLNSELFNGKADSDLSNVSNTSGFRRLIEVYKGNDGSWYKVYAEYDPSTGDFVGNWCEQGGECQPASSNSYKEVTLLKPFADTNYNVNATAINDTSYNYADKFCSFRALTTTTVTISERYISGNSVLAIRWQAKGYIS